MFNKNNKTKVNNKISSNNRIINTIQIKISRIGKLTIKI